jgi:phosphatidylglycerol:prolipoprotein diacylglycerol transferase
MAIDFPNIDPVALSVGPLEIRWYALAYLSAFLLGWRYCVYLAQKDKGVRPSGPDIDDFLPWAILGVILGGRLGYVLIYQPGFYFENPLEIPKIWRGGMSFHGGLAGAAIAMLIYARRGGFSVLRLADLFACAAPIGLFFGRIANFINGELFGRVADTVPWAVIFPGGGSLPRHPSQLYEAALEGLLIFGVLFVLARQDSVRGRPGLLAGLFLILYAASRISLEKFREPDAHIGLFFDVVSMGQLLSLPMVLAGAVLVAFAFMRNKQGQM